ncbi:GTP cyclohydrolase FolE2 [Balneatrix alpica]|uniref:GTP cyclohydrolase FolE2 n=1 Tax=Balneatrix alpica TaxID=75684 RepID=A0ABV5ZGM2_9GAMM|nr:GTP cyclohydrolase FolE2 [Balneatrix alpica]
MNSTSSTALPDIAASQLAYQPRLDWVGMEKIPLPIKLLGQEQRAAIDIGVDLCHPRQKGIHMSRLYLGLQQMSGMEWQPEQLRPQLDRLLSSHAGLAKQLEIRLHTELLLPRPSLRSNLEGWQSYPLWLTTGFNEQGMTLQMEFWLTYSSTCPCSAALSQSAQAEAFEQHFKQQPLTLAAVSQWLQSPQGLVATPHSQRSLAKITLQLSPQTTAWPLRFWLDKLEQALGTPVQTAVKRQDEQAFAERNAANLMFCEDAARRLGQQLAQGTDLLDWRLQVEHQESLHGHNAVAYASAGGWHHST